MVPTPPPHPVSREFWQVLVYCSSLAIGSPTGVVFSGDPVRAGDCLRIAACLGYPDTVFLRPTADPAVWNARAFSPSEELALCTQGLIAAFRVIRQTAAPAPPAEIRFATPAGHIVVDCRDEAHPDLAWLTAPYAVVGRVASPPFLKESEWDLLIYTGRLRLVRELADPAELEALSLPPDQVLAFCRTAQISGLCLFARTGPRQARMRVFTTSRDGAEDAATGGAAMAILPYLSHWRPEAPGDPETVWTIQQGVGPVHRRGTLHTRLVPGGQEAAVGGRHQLVCRGSLILG